MADENDFQMTPVSSSQIAAVGFNAATSQGRVLFSKGNALYEYDNCSESEYTAIVNGDMGGSVGITFGSLWKGIKPFRRLS